MKTTTQGHTATPWRVIASNAPSQPTEIEDKATGLPIAHVYGASPGYDTKGNIHEAAPEALANADFIVQACNAHEELVGALQELYDEANKQMLKGVEGWPAGLSIACANARDALVKAKTP